VAERTACIEKIDLIALAHKAMEVE
jgi:hypothetical protein